MAGHRPLDPATLAGLSDERLTDWADGYANSYNFPALEQVQEERARRRQLARRRVAA